MQVLTTLSNGPWTEAQVLPRKSAGFAWLLSLVLPGAGHLYLGLYLRAGLVFAVSLVGMMAFVSMLSSAGPSRLPPLVPWVLAIGTLIVVLGLGLLGVVLTLLG